MIVIGLLIYKGLISKTNCLQQFSPVMGMDIHNTVLVVNYFNSHQICYMQHLTTKMQTDTELTYKTHPAKIIVAS